LIQNKFI